MNKLKKSGTTQDENKDIMVMVPFALLKAIEEKQDAFLKLLQPRTQQAPPPKEYLTEQEAKLMLHKGKSWFFNMRTSGKLSGVKVGATRFYKMTELNQLFNNAN